MNNIICHLKKKHRHLLSIYFIIYLSVLGFSRPVFVEPILIYLGVGPSTSLRPKSKETLSPGTLVLLLSNIPPLPNSSLTKRLRSLINYSHSINQSGLGLGTTAGCFCGDAIRSGVKETGGRLPSLVPCTLFISFTCLPSGPLGSGTRRPELLQASQTSEVLTRPWE